MKSIIATFLILCLATSEVIVLNDDNFETETQMTTGATTGNWFVKFYAPWCGHCKQLAPIWESLADELAGEVNVAEVDATENSVLAKAYSIEGFPTLYYFVDGKYVQYNGRREVDDLKDFVLEGYKDLEMTPCPKLPSKFDKLKQKYSVLAGRELADHPFSTCFYIMGAGCIVGIIVATFYLCCCKRTEYEPITEEKKNN